MIEAELLTEISIQEIGRYTSNPLYGVEEKHNGERRIICKDAQGIRDWNREGNTGKGLPVAVANALRRHRLSSFVIDVELVKGSIFILDVLILGENNYIGQPYKERKAAAHGAFDNCSPLITVVKLVEGERNKKHFILDCAENFAEGVVIKNLDAFYKEGLSGQHFKLKFWKELDAVVLAPSAKGHNSVDVGLYTTEGKLQRICGVSLNGKRAVKMGEVIKMEYLYGTRKATKQGIKMEVVQPNFVDIRDDKNPRKCTMDQIVVNRNFR